MLNCATKWTTLQISDCSSKKYQKFFRVWLPNFRLPIVMSSEESRKSTNSLSIVSTSLSACTKVTKFRRSLKQIFQSCLFSASALKYLISCIKPTVAATWGTVSYLRWIRLTHFGQSIGSVTLLNCLRLLMTTYTNYNENFYWNKFGPRT